MSHLTPEQFIDVLDAEHAAADDSSGRLARVGAHLEACTACSTELDRIRTARLALEADEIPAPSPLFWDHLSARVHDAIAAEATNRPSHSARLWTLAGGAAAVLILVTLTVRSRPAWQSTDAKAAVVAPIASEVAPDLFEDDSWQLIADLTASTDWDTAWEQMLRPGASDRALLDLSDGEREELARLLRAELAHGTPSL